MKFLLSVQAIAFFDCIWSTYELFSSSITFFSSAHFSSIFHPGERLIRLEIPKGDDGGVQTYLWFMSIFTLILSIVWVDSSLQLLIATREVRFLTTEELNRYRYWLYLSYGLLFLFAFKTYSSTGYVSAFVFSCLALLYRGGAIYIVHEKKQAMQDHVDESGGVHIHSRLTESNSFGFN